jgi:hypothetical protein
VDDAVIGQAIDRLAAFKINQLRVLVYGRNNDRPRGQPVRTTADFKPYLNPWPAVRPDNVTNLGFDLTRFNAAFASQVIASMLDAHEMNDAQPTGPAVDRTCLRVTTHKESEREDRVYWLSRSPQERLRQVEFLRELNYGSEVLNQRLQRVLTVSERSRG